MADKKISQLDLAAQINNDAVIPMSQENGGEQTTYKALITALAAKIGEGTTFSNLNTNAKNLVGAINEIEAGGGGGGSSNANLAPDYDATSTYAVGDWCIYNGTLYQCTTAITVAEAFDPTHWTAKKVVDAFDDIDTALSGKVNTSDFLATNLPIASGSATNTKDYIDNKIPTRTDFIRYEDKSIGAVEFTQSYFAIPSASKPSVPSGYMFLMGVVRDYGSITGGTSAVINVDAVGGNYLFGTTGSKFSNVLVRYIYIKS